MKRLYKRPKLSEPIRILLALPCAWLFLCLFVRFCFWTYEPHYPVTEPRPDSSIAVWQQNSDAVRKASHEKNSALWKAAIRNRPEEIRLLLKQGAEVNSRDGAGKTALFYAQGESADLLLAHGADVDARDIEGTTVLIHAVQYHLEIVSLLIQHGADVNARDNEECTALMFASDEDTIRRLIRHGADVNARDKAGRTALICAAQDHSFETVRLLLAWGAKRDIRDREGKTARDYAGEPLCPCGH